MGIKQKDALISNMDKNLDQTRLQKCYMENLLIEFSKNSITFKRDNIKIFKLNVVQSNFKLYKMD